MPEFRAGASPLFLRDEDLRQGLDMLFFAWRDLAAEADAALAKDGPGRAHHRALYFIGRNPGLSVSELMAILGNYQINPDRLRERGYSVYAEFHALAPLYVGASSLLTHARTDYQTLESSVTRQAHGVFARTTPVKQLVVLAEADALLRSRRDLGYVAFLQVDYEVVQGLHFAATGEVLDSGYQDTGDPFDTARKVPGFGYPRYGGWLTLDWFFLPQLEARFDAVARQDDPFTLLAQLHVYL